MSKIINQGNYVENGQFSGGEVVTLLSGSAFNQATQIYGGLYVGEIGTLVVKTADGSVLSFENAYGFIPGLISAVSASSTATNIIGLR